MISHKDQSVRIEPTWLRSADLRKRIFSALATVSVLVTCVSTLFWKLTLSREYTFLAHPDGASEVLPRLQAQVYAVRHGFVLLWDPYSWMGIPFLAQMEPGVANPFNLLLAFLPLKDGHIQLFYVHLWYVALHVIAAAFAYFLLRDLDISRGSSLLGAVLYATSGFIGNTGWPQFLEAAMLGPLVFLFVLRTMRGRTPWKSAVWAGVFLGVSWTGGHHVPALDLTIAAFAMGVSMLLPRGSRRLAAGRLLTMFVFMVLVSAVQMLPSFEYGKLAVRWTESGVLGWHGRIQFAEHEHSGFSPVDFLHIAWPHGNQTTSTFVGTVALSLAFLAVWGNFRRREVKLMLLVALGALVYSIPSDNPLYGFMYSLFPLVEKAREPIMALTIFQLAIVVLAAFGLDVLLRNPESGRNSGITRTLTGFGLLSIAVLQTLEFAQPLSADPRIGMIGLIALLVAGLFTAWRRGYVGRRGVLIFSLLLLMLEQGNELGHNYQTKDSPLFSQLLKPIQDSSDIANYLNAQPNPKRIEVNRSDVPFSFGQWNRIDAVESYTTGMLQQTLRLNWWQDRLSRMYAVGYAVSRKPTRPGQIELLTSQTGLKLYRNPDPFPRAWTVHQIRVEPNDEVAASVVRDGNLDLRNVAVMVNSAPSVSVCAEPDRVPSIVESAQSTYTKVDMRCRGLLVIPDNWFPGWRAEVDGKSAQLWRVNTAIRGVVVPQGLHEVRTVFRPWSVYLGFASMLFGIAGAIFLARRNETDGVDLLMPDSSTPELPGPIR